MRRAGAGTEIIGMMRIKMRKNFAKLVLCVIIVLSSVIEFAATAVGASPLSDGSSSGSITSTEDGLPSYTDELTEIARGIISWKKSDNGAAADGYLINETYLELAGTTPGDWYPIGLSRLGVSDNYDGYLAVIKDVVKERYSEPGKLSAAKATEWHRISLAVLASGGNPTDMGKDSDGNTINLIADGTYDRGKTTPLGRQGINGWIWGLIALDSMKYEIPEGAYYTRDDIITEILRQQLEDGGFALSGKRSDPDITAMALQALAPYYNSEKKYAYTRKATGEDVTKTVFEVCDEALSCLSQLQLDSGGYSSWGTENVESTDQVIVALCCLDIDPLSDERFIKNGKTLLDGVKLYRMEDGGFVHSYTYDPDNPSSLPDKSNSMASEQTLYTMAAMIRYYSGMRLLYDFRQEQSEELKSRISSLESKLSGLTADADETEVTELLSEFYSIPESERCYVSGYRQLSDRAASLGIDIGKIAGETEVIESPSSGGDDSALLYFSPSDIKAADSLPENLTTEQYVTVTTLLDKLNGSEDFPEKDIYIKKLSEAKTRIAEIQKEIDDINSDVKGKLYPFDKISLSDKKTVDDIVSRYNALSEYDREKIERYEDVIKTKTKLDNLQRGIIISVALSAAAIALTVLLVLRIRKRRRRKADEMEELAAMYKDED